MMMITDASSMGLESEAALRMRASSRSEVGSLVDKNTAN